jgi:hypothetical protein
LAPEEFIDAGTTGYSCPRNGKAVSAELLGEAEALVAVGVSK